MILETRGLGKRFFGTLALDGVDFDLRPGEVHAICGENGAGKSTLIKLLGGIHPFGSYEGKIRIDGQEVRFESPRDAEDAGIAVIYQELALVPEMTIAENLLLGHLPLKFGLIDWNEVYQRARTILAEAKMDLDPTRLVKELGVGERQLVEIAKAIAKRARILIFDEPTAALSRHEVESLLDLVRDYRRAGIACIYISHKLDEVFAIADRISVLRDGKSILCAPAESVSQAEVIRHMVGREITDFYPRAEQSTQKTERVLLEVQDLSVARDRRSAPLLNQISFQVHAGEALGIGGLMGAGRSELLLHLFGAFGTRISGRVLLDGVALLDSCPEICLKHGLALVSEDRKRHGLIGQRSVGYHLTLSSLGRYRRGPLLDHALETRDSRKLFASLRIKAQGLDTSALALSGGNQQKVVLGKALLTEPKVLLLDEPTRGIDVGAKLEVYAIVRRLLDEGKAVVLVSSELPELMGLSDRILMLHAGYASRIFTRSEFSEERLLSAAMGKTEQVSA